MAVVQEFTWTDDRDELLLKMVKIFKMKKESTRIGLGLVKSKYEDRSVFFRFFFFFIGMQEVPSSINIGEIYWCKQITTGLKFPSNKICSDSNLHK